MAAKPGKSTDILDAVALLVIDMQPSFLDVIEGAPAVVERCGFAIEAARTFGLRVLFSEQVPDKLGATDSRLLHLVPNARVFAKNTFSALQAEGIQEYLRRQGIYHVLIAGIEIPVCVYQTALHASDLDFDVTVLSDCVTGRRVEDGLVTLEALTRANCHVLPAETVFYSMIGHSAHPLFSAYNTLVKRYGQPGGLDAAPPAPEPQSHAHERRPQLAAPEDRAEAPEPEEFAGADAGEDEPYIGRGSDGAPAAEPADSSASREASDENDDEPDTEGDDEAEDATDTGEETGGDDRPSRDSSADSPSQSGGQSSEGGGKRRRGRRRRGGARRRRARERAGPPGSAPDTPPRGEPTGAPERAPQSDAGGERAAPEGERAPE